MRILLTGANGMLGTDLADRLGREHDCTGVDIGDFDITDRDAVFKYVRDFKPEMLIHPAAFTDVDGCETQSERAYLINARGTENLAAVCGELSVPILYFSTDYVFDGEKGSPYSEDDEPNPRSVYGKTKLEGENFIKRRTEKYFIVRIQSLYGKNGKNFVSTILRAAREKGALTVVNDQWSSPTYTKDVCGAVSELIKTIDYGTYHITNSGITTWYEFTEEILKQAGLTGVVLTPCAAEDYPRPAKRPRYSPLHNGRWAAAGREPLRPYTEALSDYLREIL